ncbi:calcium-activated BK potassium channel alpha subunit domain-containing protein [Ditylenchus destructor]|uniref:Calcium-activated BK potassium channel alpha subunit domain-containing protein n=1 Tax=Ditylenchus destructor TaxID=166010 RepID=A0AAD4R823_9BILA|nr:calcium-activated BK potassium channel alpha subunit domain-containing protein [Ditylenchus destructor]
MQTVDGGVSTSFIARVQYEKKLSGKARLQEYFLEDHKSSLRIRQFNLFIKILSCIFYCMRVELGEEGLPDSIKVTYGDKEIPAYEYLLWVNSNEYLWLAQTIVAVVSISETVIIFYLTYKGSILGILLDVHFLLELITSAPLIVTIFVSKWRTILYVPIFLNCWLANAILQDILHNFHRVSQLNHSVLSKRQMVALLSVLFSLIFTGTCGMEHLQRAGYRRFNLFNSLYFVMVTFSTVGYGDWYPDVWMSRLYVVVLIIVAFLVLPSKIEALGQTWLEREKSVYDYTKGFSHEEGIHVVVTITHLEPDFIQDFLNEFFAHPKHQGYLVVLLSPCDLDNRMKMLLRIPLWSHRIVYVRGSALKDEDLERAHMTTAKACFILSSRHAKDKNASDEQTILRSWAIRDFAHNVPQYVQVFGEEAKMHIRNAAAVICEEEFKYCLLANNCISPAISTFVTLLMYTSRGEEGQNSSEGWQRLYGFHSGNEIYDIEACKSRFFGPYIGKTFTEASFNAHQRYGVCLIGLKIGTKDSRILLNPGRTYLIQPTDWLYYIALTNEESLKEFQRKQRQSSRITSSFTSEDIDKKPQEYPMLCFKQNKRKPSTKVTPRGSPRDGFNDLLQSNSLLCQQSRDILSPVKESSSSDEEIISTERDRGPCQICSPTDICIAQSTVKTKPPLNSYAMSSNSTACHVLKYPRPLCCLELSKKCEHCPFESATDYNWRNSPLILAIDKISSGINNLLFPLRAFYLPVHSLQPIVFILELDGQLEPCRSFLDMIAHFPDVFWMKGEMSNLDDLLNAGISTAEHLIILKEDTSVEEEHLADCKVIISMQKISGMFPKLKLTTELTHSSNMRFLTPLFDFDEFSLQQSKCEERERKRGSNLAFMFRLPFSSGKVFSAHMIDRLLYQTFLKNYLVDFIKLLLGMDQTSASGYLSFITITEEDLWIRTYGCLYKKLCSSASDIPIGIFRSEKMKNVNSNNALFSAYRSSTAELVSQRMRSLVRYYNCDHANLISYVIINPSPDLTINAGDIIYIIRAPVSENMKDKVSNSEIGLRRSMKLSRQTTLFRSDA